MATRLSGRRGKLTRAQRGQLIQRVIVEGWSEAEAAAAFGIGERLVAAWVTDYRRRGMASLHGAPSAAQPVEFARLSLARPLLALWQRWRGALRRRWPRRVRVRPTPLPGTPYDRRGSQDRR